MPTVTVVCLGLSDVEGAALVSDILEEFSHRPWQTMLRCQWDAGVLRLTATNDFDSDGKALLDEFCDAVFACSNPVDTISFFVESVAG